VVDVQLDDGVDVDLLHVLACDGILAELDLIDHVLDLLLGGEEADGPHKVREVSEGDAVGYCPPLHAVQPLCTQLRVVHVVLELIHQRPALAACGWVWW
jgi:hypothetical protein